MVERVFVLLLLLVVVMAVGLEQGEEGEHLLLPDLPGVLLMKHHACDAQGEFGWIEDRLVCAGELYRQAIEGDVGQLFGSGTVVPAKEADEAEAQTFIGLASLGGVRGQRVEERL
jgi:hypothetical protein